MEFLNVIAAAVGCFALGAVWYNLLSRPWLSASGVARDAEGRPAGGGSPLPFVISFVMMLLVAGMMRHVFATTPGIDTIGKGIVAGLGVGAFFITPWIAINNAYTMRPAVLTAIDGGYAILGCGIIGAILMAF